MSRGILRSRAYLPIWESTCLVPLPLLSPSLLLFFSSSLLLFFSSITLLTKPSFRYPYHSYHYSLTLPRFSLNAMQTSDLIKNWSSITWWLLKVVAFVTNQCCSLAGFGQNFSQLHLIFAILVITAILMTIVIVTLEFRRTWIAAKYKNGDVVWIYVSFSFSLIPIFKIWHRHLSLEHTSIPHRSIVLATPCFTFISIRTNASLLSLRFVSTCLNDLDRRFASFYSPCGLNTPDHSCSDLLRVLAFRKYKTKKGKKKLLVWSVEPDGYWEML